MNEEINNNVATEQGQEQEVKTYTQDEVLKLIQSESDKRVTEALKTQRVKFEKELNKQKSLVWTIVNKVDTIYKEKCRVQLLRAVPSTILLFHLVSSFRENYAVSWHYRILRCIRTQITGVPAENDMFYG